MLLRAPVRWQRVQVRRQLQVGALVRHHGHGHGHLHAGAGSLTGSEQDNRSARLAINIGALSNVSLAVFKAGAGAVTGSAALLADALHSLTDLFSDAVTYASHSVARAPPDAKYPYGRGRAEAVGSFIVSGTLVAAGATMGWQSVLVLGDVLAERDAAAILILGHSEAIQFLKDPAMAALAVAGTAGSIVVKEGLYRYTNAIALRMRSSVLAANALHHRADAWTSAVSAIGVGGALAGVPALDPLAAVLVSVALLQQGGSMCVSAVRELLDAQMDADVVQGAEAICRLMPDVTRYSRLRARRVGSVVHVDVEIGLRPHLTISAAHHVCDELRSRIMAALPQVEDVLVHPFPDEAASAIYCADASCAAGGNEATTVGTTESHHRPPAAGPASSPARALGPAETEAAVRKAALGVKEVTAVTHLRLYYGRGGGERQVRVEMEVLLPLDRPLRECVRACKRVRAAVEALPFVAVADVHLEVEPV